MKLRKTHESNRDGVDGVSEDDVSGQEMLTHSNFALVSLALLKIETGLLIVELVSIDILVLNVLGGMGHVLKGWHINSCCEEVSVVGPHSS